MPNYDLTGKIVLVTGGNTGIGAATVRAFVAEQAHVCLVYYQMPQLAEALCVDATQRGARAIRYQADLGDPAIVPAIFEYVEHMLGPAHILINNAAHSAADSVATLTADSLDRHYAVNARATALLTAEFARRYQHAKLPAGAGRVINLSSGQSLTGMPGELGYVASKGAIEALTQTFALELAPFGITVNAVDPGITDTGWITSVQRAQFLAAAPFGRLGTPEDAARLIVFLASAEARWITGQLIRSRGGM